MLRMAGADVTLHWEPGGHALTASEVEAARRWIAKCLMAAHTTRRSQSAGADAGALSDTT
jgi:hypothetical protein